MKPPNQIHAGCFQLGNEQVDLFVVTNEESGGEFYFCPEPGQVGRIRVFIENQCWNHAVSVLLHEALEYSFTRCKDRYVPCGKLTGDHANYLFVFDHVEFVEHSRAVGEFMAQALPKLADIYNRERRKKEKKLK